MIHLFFYTNISLMLSYSRQLLADKTGLNSRGEKFKIF